MPKKKLDIIYEDKYLIIINKPSGILTISRDNRNDKNLYDEVKEYVKKQNPKNKIFIVHRLDKDTSGLIIFAKNEKVKRILQTNWTKVKRYYYAVVNGIVKENNHLENYLLETKTHDVIITKDKEKGILAITNFEVMEYNKKYTLLNIEIKTGRKNQIRVQLANIKHPIVGDKKYGNKERMPLCLQAYRLEFLHPITNKNIEIEIKLPKNLENLIK
uniref:RluA family pseudouridine synthase n=1 Tax=Candidatus Onthocola sp. TaxID=3085646 RepID=UPI003FF04925